MWLIVLILALNGCATTGGREPEWEADGYAISYEGGQCHFVNDFGDDIACPSDSMRNYILIPLTDLVKLKEKFQRCERWR